MTPMTQSLDELADRLDAGGAFGPADADAVLGATDLVRIGMLGEAARRRVTGDQVTFGRVATVVDGAFPAECGHAGEVRLVGAPPSIDAARAVVAEGRRFAGSVTLTGFSLADLVQLAGHDHLVLAELAQALRADGLDAVAESPLDRLGEADLAVELIRAVRHGGLATWRLTVDRAPVADRLALATRAALVQREVGGIAAFAPLPRFDPTDTPSTGYDDVRTIAVARLVCSNIERIQVDWPLYGPKLAQVAVAYGANDIDGVAAIDTQDLGPRRAPVEDIKRQIRATAATPAERDGRYQVRA